MRNNYLRDTAELVLPAVRETIAKLELDSEDAAAVKLAERLAALIDEAEGHCRGCDDSDCKRGRTDAWLLRWIAPELLAVLDSLGATPLARSRIKGGKAEGPQRMSKLVGLRSAHSA